MIAVSPPTINRIFNVLDVKIKVENKANNIPEPFTKPACINADAGVGEVMDESNQRWNGYMADWINAAIMMQRADMKTMCCGRFSSIRIILLMVKVPLS